MKISVALCTYNGEKYLPSLLKSIASQSVLPTEMVISDDGSSDNTVNILHDFKNTNSFVVNITTSPEKRGVNSNYEHALKQCIGDIILIADQDDIWHDDKIETLADIMSSTNASIAFTDASLIDADNVAMSESLWNFFGFEFASSRHNLLDRLILSNVVTGSTIAMSKDILGVILPFPLSDDLLYDEWSALLVALHGNVNIIPVDKVLMKYRVHDAQFTAKLRAPVEAQFPFNRKVNYNFIKRRQQFFSMIKNRIAQLGHSSEKLSSVCLFWDSRVKNYNGFSITIKLNLSSAFVKGKYHSNLHRPLKAWIKDLIV